jgi:hypothetical protein
LETKGAEKTAMKVPRERAGTFYKSKAIKNAKRRSSLKNALTGANQVSRFRRRRRPIAEGLETPRLADIGSRAYIVGA